MQLVFNNVTPAALLV